MSPWQLGFRLCPRCWGLLITDCHAHPPFSPSRNGRSGWLRRHRRDLCRFWKQRKSCRSINCDSTKSRMWNFEAYATSSMRLLISKEARWPLHTDTFHEYSLRIDPWSPALAPCTPTAHQSFAIGSYELLFVLKQLCLPDLHELGPGVTFTLMFLNQTRLGAREIIWRPYMWKSWECEREKLTCGLPHICVNTCVIVPMWHSSTSSLNFQDSNTYKFWCKSNYGPSGSSKICVYRELSDHWCQKTYA